MPPSLLLYVCRYDVRRGVPRSRFLGVRTVVVDLQKQKNKKTDRRPRVLNAFYRPGSVLTLSVARRRFRFEHESSNNNDERVGYCTYTLVRRR